MIAVHYITQSPNDQKESLIAVNELNKRLGKEDYIIVVDHRYWHIKSLEKIYNPHTRIVIPDRQLQVVKKKNQIKNKRKNQI